MSFNNLIFLYILIIEKIIKNIIIDSENILKTDCSIIAEKILKKIKTIKEINNTITLETYLSKI
jgi:hypothetical protein